MIIVTRQQGESPQLRDWLLQNHLPFLYQPCLTIIPLASPQPGKTDNRLLITSRNGLDSLPDTVSLPAYLVGESTAALARARGLEVLGWAQTARALEQLILECEPADRARFFYPRGQDIAYDIQSALQRKAYQITTVTAYKADSVTTLQPETKRALSLDQINQVLFYSRRAATTFCALAQDGLLQQTDKPIALALSPRIGNSLPSHLFSERLITAEPTDSAMLALLTALYPDLHPH